MLDQSLLLQKLKTARTKFEQKSSLNHQNFLQNFLSAKLSSHETQSRLRELGARLAAPQWRGNLGQSLSIPAGPKNYAVLAVDASQIWPDRHSGLEEIALVQVAGALIQYGEKTSATRYFSEIEILMAQDFAPTVFDKNLVEQKRDLLELSCALAWAKEANVQPLILMDGSLQFLCRRFSDPQQVALPEFSTQFFQLLTTAQEDDLQLTFYTSRPNSQQFSELLKIENCHAPYFDKALCAGGCGQTSCTVLARTPDAQIFATLLPAQCSSQAFCTDVAETIFGSCFFQAASTPGIGNEIAKVEWLQKKPHFDQPCFMPQLLDQTSKGQGFPVTLALAHHLAMISFSEQQLFTELLSKTFPQQQQTLSLKSLSKKFVNF